MFDLSRHIEYLLVRHDCVVVPGLGAFFIGDESAKFDPASGLFLPPSRLVGFNPQVHTDDGMLRLSIARRDGVSPEKAKVLLETAVAELRGTLQSEGAVTIGRIGSLALTDDSDFPQFRPGTASLPALRYAGLEPIPAEQLIEEPEDAAVAEETDLHSHGLVFTPLLKVAASVIIAMIGIGIFMSTANLGPGVNLASLAGNIFTPGQSKTSVDTLPDLPPREIILSIASPRPAATPAAAAPENRPASTSDRYVLVVASFPNETTARKHIASINDPALSVIEMDGKCRVYAASARTLDEARSKLDGLTGRYPNIWICKR